MDNLAAGNETASDEELMAKISRGDVSAFGQFYDRHSAVLYGVTLRILKQTEEAEDALQDALTILWERAALYNPSFGRPLSWAVTLTRNRAIDYLRARSREPEIVADGDCGSSEFSETFETEGLPHEMNDEILHVRQALDSLPQEQRQAIELAFFGGKTQAQVATITNAPLGTVKARIRRGLLTLKHGLEGRL